MGRLGQARRTRHDGHALNHADRRHGRLATLHGDRNILGASTIRDYDGGNDTSVGLLDRLHVPAQHGWQIVYDGLGSSADEFGTPAPYSILVSSAWCRIWAVQLGFGYGSTARSEGEVSDSDYQTHGTLQFYDKGAFLRAAGGFCAPTKYVQPYLVTGFDLPLGGTRTALNNYELTDGDVGGGRFHVTGGANLLIPKAHVGVGVRLSFNHVFPQMTLINDPMSDTTATWGAEGGGANYFTLGLVGLIFFR